MAKKKAQAKPKEKKKAKPPNTKDPNIAGPKPDEAKTKNEDEKLKEELEACCPNCHQKLIIRKFEETIEPAVAAVKRARVTVQIDPQQQLAFD